jgi:cytochrome c5
MFLAWACIAGLPALADDELPAGEGRDIVEYACSQCHDLIQVTAASKTPEQWQYLVTQMINQGAPIEDYETETVVRYLAEHFGEK